MRINFLMLAGALLLALPASAESVRAVAPSPVTYLVVETAVATHSQHPEPPFGCFAKIQPADNPANANWVYVEYNFICQLKPADSIALYTYAGMTRFDTCDTGEQGDYICGLHGKDAQGNPIDRPPDASLAGMDMRAIPDLVEMVVKTSGYRARQYGSVLEEYAASTAAPDAKSAILTYKDQLLAAKNAAGTDALKQGALTSLLLTLGVALPVGDSLSVLGDYLSALEPRHLTALQTIASHGDDPSIDAAKLMFFYVRNFVDNPTREEPNRDAVVKAVSALGPRLQPSVGLLLERMRDSAGWPETLQKEAASVACAAFMTVDSAATHQTLVVDNYGGARAIACP